MNKIKNDTPVLNFFLAFMLVTVIVGYDIAHTPNVEAQDIAPVASPSPISEVSNIKVGEVHVTEYQPRNFITVKVSHYWPDLGGLNCYNFVNGKCISRMANGEKWENHVDEAIACPKELKFGTKIKVLGKVWTCKDRGSMITKTESGAYWIDMLTPKAVVPYGEEIKAEIL